MQPPLRKPQQPSVPSHKSLITRQKKTRFVSPALRVCRENKRASASRRMSEDVCAVLLAKTVPKACPAAPVTTQTKHDVCKALNERDGRATVTGES